MTSFQPTRSVSFPSRSQPNTNKIDETVRKLRSFDLSSPSTSCNSLGAETMQLSLLSLAELYGQVQELFHSNSTQQALQGKLAEEALDVSVGLLDTCSTARDLIQRLKDQVHDLQSTLRRKGCSSIESELRAYVGFRKKMAKDVTRCLKALKQADGKYGISATSLINLDNPYVTIVVRVLREVYEVTIAVFRSFFLFLSTPTKTNGWSLISKLVSKKSGASSENLNEVAVVDSAVHGLEEAKMDVQLVRGRLQALDASIQILDGELECLFKCLVENRVSLLNILTN